MAFIEQKVQDLSFHTSDFLPLLRCVTMAETSRKKIGPTVRENFGRKMQDVYIHLVTKAFKEIHRYELVELRMDLEDHNTTTIEKENEMVKCAVCGVAIRGEARNTKDGFIHVLCPKNVTNANDNNQNSDKEKIQEDNDMGTKETNTKETNTKETGAKDNKEAIKKAAEKSKTKTEKTAPKTEKTGKEKEAPKKSDGLFRDGSKYSRVYGFLKKGITFEDLQKNLAEEFGENTAKGPNVRIYIKTIGEKTDITHNEKTGIYKAK
jgi:hypothetical protein